MRPAVASRRPAPSARAGFSFIEVLVVMGIIAVLVGIGIAVYQIAMKKAPETKARAQLAKVRANLDHWKGRYKFFPPSDFSKLSLVLGPQMKLGRPTPSNTTNAGNEAIYQAFFTPGFGVNPDIGDGEKSNNDEDKLDKPYASSGDPDLWEIKDPWDNPLVYFTDGDYKDAEKNPPTYLNGQGEAVNPKPYRDAKGGGFSQPNGYQLYSMGPDGQPNTDDDLKSWE